MGKTKPARAGQEDDLVMVGGRIPRDLHKAFKHAAVDEGISLQEFLIRAIKEQLASREPSKRR